MIALCLPDLQMIGNVAVHPFFGARSLVHFSYSNNRAARSACSIWQLLAQGSSGFPGS